MTKNQGNDPIHQKDRLWFYWDECWAWEIGPFSTEEAARKDLKDYCTHLDKQSEEMLRTGCEKEGKP